MGNKGSKSDLDENEYNEIYGNKKDTENDSYKYNGIGNGKKSLKMKKSPTGNFSVIKVEKTNDFQSIFKANDIDINPESHKIKPLYSKTIKTKHYSFSESSKNKINEDSKNNSINNSNNNNNDNNNNNNNNNSNNNNNNNNNNSNNNNNNNNNSKSHDNSSNLNNTDNNNISKITNNNNIKNNENHIPQNNIDVQIETFMDEINVPPDKREAIRNLSEEQKLLMISSRIKTIINNNVTNEDEDIINNIEKLKNSPTLETVKNLSVLLRTKPIKWITKFVNNNGLNIILNNLNDIQNDKSNNPIK
eukprot:jgi/Orpsp1_1/1185855/evm.model.c7180000095637.1